MRSLSRRKSRHKLSAQIDMALENLEGRRLLSTTTFVPATGPISSQSPYDSEAYGQVAATKGSLALISDGFGVVDLYDTSTTTLIRSFSDPTGNGDSNFGSSVAFYGDTGIAIGASGDSGGTVYLFPTADSSAPLVLSAPQYTSYDPDQGGSDPGFGHSLAGYGDNLLVDITDDPDIGTNGEVLLINSNSGSVIQQFTNPAPGAYNYDNFGSQMTVSGSQILFLANLNTDFDPNTGTQAVFQYDGSSFNNQLGQLREYTDPTGDNNFSFGAAMAFSGNDIVIGAPQFDFGTDPNTGNPTLIGGPSYQYDASTGDLVHTFNNPLGSNWTGFGASLAIDGDTLVVGAPFTINSAGDAYSGSVYAFDLRSGDLLASADNPLQDGNFGQVVGSLGSGAYLITDPSASVVGSNEGAAYTYDVETSGGQQHNNPVANAGADQVVLANQSVALDGSASTADAGSTITAYDWDFNYDGTNFNVDASGETASTSYAANGVYTVALRVTDDHGFTNIDTAVVTAQNAAIVNGDLVIQGTSGNDTAVITGNPNGGIDVTFDGVSQGTLSPTGHVIFNGGDGNDTLISDNSVPNTIEAYGGTGDDTLQGGGGSDILVGGDGNDRLVSGAQRDLLIGGTGKDHILGKAGQDILVSGSTSYDANPTALNAIMAEWDSSHTFAKRVANVLNGSGTPIRANGNYFLTPDVTVFDDGKVDTLTGGNGNDWFIINATGSGVLDQITDQDSGDVVSDT